MNETIKQEMIKETRRQVMAAFRSLRKQNFICRPNFMCCGGCALAALNPVTRKQKNIVAVAYWHKQADEKFREKGYLHIYFSGVEKRMGMIATGNRIVKALKEVGLNPIWNGSGNTAIEVKTI